MKLLQTTHELLKCASVIALLTKIHSILWNIENTLQIELNKNELETNTQNKTIIECATSCSVLIIFKLCKKRRNKMKNYLK